MKEKLIKYVCNNININFAQAVYSQMCYERSSLNHVSPSLHFKLMDLVDDFVCDNDLPNDWFFENFIDYEDLLDYVLDDFD